MNLFALNRMKYIFNKTLITSALIHLTGCTYTANVNYPIETKKVSNSSNECLLTISDERLNSWMLDYTAQSPHVLIGKPDYPIKTNPETQLLFKTELCKDSTLRGQPIQFTLEEFSCDVIAGFNNGKARVKINIDYVMPNGNKKSSHVNGKASIENDLSISLYNLCGVAVRDAIKKMNKTINDDINN